MRLSRLNFLQECLGGWLWSWLDRSCWTEGFGFWFAGGAVEAAEGDADHGGRGGVGEGDRNILNLVSGYCDIMVRG